MILVALNDFYGNILGYFRFFKHFLDEYSSVIDLLRFYNVFRLLNGNIKDF